MAEEKRGSGLIDPWIQVNALLGKGSARALVPRQAPCKSFTFKGDVGVQTDTCWAMVSLSKRVFS
jgi:hypothetical protein